MSRRHFLRSYGTIDAGGSKTMLRGSLVGRFVLATNFVSRAFRFPYEKPITRVSTRVKATPIWFVFRPLTTGKNSLRSRNITGTTIMNIRVFKNLSSAIKTSRRRCQHEPYTVPVMKRPPISIIHLQSRPRRLQSQTSL